MPVTERLAPSLRAGTPTAWTRAALGPMARLGAFYAAGCALGFALLVAGFRVGLLGGLDILFYKGLALIVLSALATFAILVWATRRRRDPGPRDAFAATVLSLSLNLSFLVVVPVTVDRSISIFMLGEMAARADEAFTPDAMSGLFVARYVTQGRQIERRLREQTVSGNVAPVDGGYQITRQGLVVVAGARVVAWLFNSHAGILAAPVPAASAHTRRPLNLTRPRTAPGRGRGGPGRRRAPGSPCRRRRAPP